MIDVIQAANEAGTLFIVAAGNNGRNLDKKPVYPASYRIRNIIAVAATDHLDQMPPYSNYGAGTVHLAAPGGTKKEGIFSTAVSGYGAEAGTSMACAHVSGVAALIKAQFPHLKSKGIKARLLASVDPLPSIRGKTITGGRLNAAKALSDTISLIPSHQSAPGKSENKPSIVNTQP
jgi:subtilisin family serine protease